MDETVRLRRMCLRCRHRVHRTPIFRFREDSKQLFESDVCDDGPMIGPVRPANARQGAGELWADENVIDPKAREVFEQSHIRPGRTAAQTRQILGIREPGGFIRGEIGGRFRRVEIAGDDRRQCFVLKVIEQVPGLQTILQDVDVCVRAGRMNCVEDDVAVVDLEHRANANPRPHLVVRLLDPGGDRNLRIERNAATVGLWLKQPMRIIDELALQQLVRPVRVFLDRDDVGIGVANLMNDGISRAIRRQQVDAHHADGLPLRRRWRFWQQGQKRRPDQD